MYQKHLVVGGDSFLGRHITDKLRGLHRQVVTTTRSPHHLSDKTVYLNLSDDITSWEVPENVDVAFLCAAITSMDHCKNKPEESKNVNVDNTLKLSSKLLEKGISVVFLSTNLVFDGQSAFRKAEEETCPYVEYGKQKEIVEKKLQAMSNNVSIVRLTKVLSPQSHLITRWIDQLKSGNKIYPFIDMVLSPISVDSASEVIIEIGESKKHGIWQLSGATDITYEQLARAIAKKIGSAEKLVCPIRVNESNVKFEAIPQHTTLDMSRIKSELGYSPPDVWQTIDTLF